MLVVVMVVLVLAAVGVYIRILHMEAKHRKLVKSLEDGITDNRYLQAVIEEESKTINGKNRPLERVSQKLKEAMDMRGVPVHRGNSGEVCGCLTNARVEGDKVVCVMKLDSKIVEPPNPTVSFRGYESAQQN